MSYLVPVLLITMFLLWAERGRFLRKSTVDGVKAGGMRSVLNLRALHMYIYGRWTTQYINIAKRFILPNLSGRGKQKLANSYHSKVLTPQLAKNIIAINKSVPLQELEQIIPYPAARKIILDYPLDIAVMECPCRASAPNPCKPSQVCMVIGRPFTDFILEHQPNTSKRLSQEEALKLLEEVHQKGCVHTAWFKDACLERFYVICNCCKCCCGGIKAMVDYGIPMVLSSGYVARQDNSRCNQCGLCKSACPFGAINDNLDVLDEKCMGCGVCVNKCRRQALVLERDESKGIPLDVKAL